MDRYPESTDGDVRLLFLPGYAPQLNPIGVRWQMTRARLAGMYFESVDGLNPAIAMPVGSGEVRTNGKLERFHGTLETEVGRHNSPGDFITYRQLTLASKRRRCPFLLVCLPHRLP